MEQKEQALRNRVIILNGFTDPEIVAIMNVVKSIYAEARQLRNAVQSGAGGFN